MKRSKYGNKKVFHGSIRFDSMLERDRYLILQSYAKDKKISNLCHQVPVELLVNSQKICTYNADFSYTKNGVRYLEDTKCKATITPAFRLKAKLVKALLGRDIFIVTKQTIHTLPLIALCLLLASCSPDTKWDHLWFNQRWQEHKA